MRLCIFYVSLLNIPGHWVANTRAFIGNTGMREAGVIPCRAREPSRGARTRASLLLRVESLFLGTEDLLLFLGTDEIVFLGTV